MSSVGVSYRTSGKHDALNRFLGRTCGSMRTVFPDKRLCIIDCTAGNGQSSEFSTHTSPGIICRHADMLVKSGYDVSVDFYEKSARNAKQLRNTTAGSWNVHTGDSANMIPTWGDGDVLFVVNDPNTMADWALPKAMRDAPRLTTVFSTLGCNVGGLKRLPREERKTWYAHVHDQIELLCGWHDALIVTLDGDKSQWAYMVNAPAKWRDEVENAFNKSFAYSPHELRHAWFKDNPKDFGAILDHLFLTRKENSKELPPIKNTSKENQNDLFAE